MLLAITQHAVTLAAAAARAAVAHASTLGLRNDVAVVEASRC